MTLPLLTSVVVDDSSSSLSDDTPGVTTPPSGVATPPPGVATPPSGVATPCSGVATPLFNSNAFRHVNLSNPEPNIHRHADDVTASDDFRIHRHADDVTASDDFHSTLSLSTGDPRHPDVAFARSLVNPCLRAPEPDSRNGGGMPQDKSNTASPEDTKSSILHYLRELHDRKITYQETLEAMASGRCDADLLATETANIENHSIMAVGADAQAQATQERKHLSELLTAASSSTIYSGKCLSRCSAGTSTGCAVWTSTAMYHHCVNKYSSFILS